MATNSDPPPTPDETDEDQVPEDSPAAGVLDDDMADPPEPSEPG